MIIKIIIAEGMAVKMINGINKIVSVRSWE